jgi:hypothetical protein
MCTPPAKRVCGAQLFAVVAHNPNLMCAARLCAVVAHNLKLMCGALLFAVVAHNPNLMCGARLFAVVAHNRNFALQAAPNYLKALQYHQIVAFCAPEFNTFVHSLIENVVGLMCSAFFATSLVLMLLVVCPALVRVSRLMFIDKKLSAWERAATPIELVVHRKNLLITMAWSSLLAPLLCCLPMLIFFQFFGDAMVGIMFAIFTILPIMAAFFASKQYVVSSWITYSYSFLDPVSFWIPCFILAHLFHLGPPVSSWTTCFILAHLFLFGPPGFPPHS